MFESLIEALRRPPLDRLKARGVIRQQSAAAFRAAMGDYDAFVPVVSNLRAPSFLVGSATNSAGERVPVHLSLRDLESHWMITGSTGSGKSRFVTGLFLCLLECLLGVALIDCKEGLFEAALRWLGAVARRLPADARAAFAQRVTVIDLFGSRLAPLNFCRRIPGVSLHTQASDMALAVERLFEIGFSMHMSTIMRWLIVLLISAELTLADATLLLEDEVLRGILVERSGIRALQEFFLRTYPAMPESPKTALLMRLHALFFSESLLALGADEMVDFRRIIERGEVLVVSLGKRGPEDDVKVVGNLLLQALFSAAYSAGRHPSFCVLVDEFFHLLDAPNLAARFAGALVTLRSFGVSLCLTLHGFGQLQPALRDILINSCDLNAIFRNSARNAEQLADFAPSVDPEMVTRALRNGTAPPSASEVRRLQMERLQRLPRQEFWWYDHRQPYRAIHVRGSDVPDAHVAAGMSERGLDLFIDEVGLRTGSVSLAPDEIRQQIAARRDRLRRLVNPSVEIMTREEESTVVGTKRRSRRPRIG